MENAAWHFLTSAEEAVEFDGADASVKYRSGEFTDDTLVWADGVTDGWQRLPDTALWASVEEVAGVEGIQSGGVLGDAVAAIAMATESGAHGDEVEGEHKGDDGAGSPAVDDCAHITSAWGIPFAGASAADPAVAAEAQEFDPRSAGNGPCMTWIRLDSQPTSQKCRGSKAHLPHCFVTIPTPLPTSVDAFLALRSTLGDSPEAAVALFQVAMMIYTTDTEVGARCFVCCADASNLQVRACVRACVRADGNTLYPMGLSMGAQFLPFPCSVAA